MDYYELIYLLKTSANVQEIEAYRDEIVKVIPTVSVMFGYAQQHEAHQYDLWNHSLHTVIELPKGIEDDMLYLAALLHDIGKPDCQCKSKRADDMNMHYYGHPMRSVEIIKDDVLPNLNRQGVFLAEEDIKRLLYYVEYHDYRMSMREKHLNKHLKMVSVEVFKRLMLLQIADAKAHVQLPAVLERIRVCETWYTSS